MPAAYYDIKIEEGTSFKLKLKFKDSYNKIVNLNLNSTRTPSVTTIPLGFEDELTSVDLAKAGKCGVFAKMHVRNSVNAGIVELNPINTQDSGPVSLYGESYKNLGDTAIDISLDNISIPQNATDTGLTSTYETRPNIKITIPSFITRRINYGNYLYDLELIFFKLPSGSDVPNFELISDGLDENVVVFRIMQGRFIVTPAITR